MNTTLRASAHTWIGQAIHNRQHERLGELADFVFDAETGQIIYGVLKVGGVLGIGDKLFALPWSAFYMDGAKEPRQLMLDASVERLKNAPGFDRNNWPDEPDTGFIERTHTNYS